MRRVYTIECENKFLYICTKCTKFSGVKMMKCTQNLQSIAGNEGWDDLLYKLRQGKFELLVVLGEGASLGA